MFLDLGQVAKSACVRSKGGDLAVPLERTFCVGDLQQPRRWTERSAARSHRILEEEPVDRRWGQPPWTGCRSSMARSVDMPLLPARLLEPVRVTTGVSRGWIDSTTQKVLWAFTFRLIPSQREA